MPNVCVCCGRKTGLLNGSHLNDKLCDNCFFPIGCYINAIEESDDLELSKNNYNMLVTKIHELSYSETGRQYIMWYVDDIIQKHKHKEENKILRQHQFDNFQITTGNNFDGYDISEYKGVVSGNVVLGTGFKAENDLAKSNWFGDESSVFSEKLDDARDSAIKKMINKAIDMNCNAIVALQFNYMKLSSNTIVVVVNGTAVVVEKTAKDI